MANTRILWADDNPAGHACLLGTLVREYKIDLVNVVTNAQALECAKNGGWDIVLYDIGMDNSVTGRDLPVARKLRELVSPAPVIGTTYNPLCFYKDFKDDLDDLIQSDISPDEELEDFLRLAEKHQVTLTKR